MTMRICAGLLLALWLLPAAALGAPASVQPFFGDYVGSGTAQREDGQGVEARDLDVSIKPYKDNGFTISWVTVTRDAEGGRTGADVKRRAIEENFVPSPHHEKVYVLAPEGGLFTKAETPNPLEGEPMRWAAIEGDRMSLYSMGIADDGGSEFQIYHRRLTQAGMEIDFLRMQDEQVVVRVTGTLVKVE